METTGYSGTPLAKKLGFKDEFTIRLIHPPDYYVDLFTDLPANLHFEADPETLKDCIHFFTQDAAELEKELIALKQEIKQNGVIWVSWPKKSSKVPTDITEDVVRGCALRIGLVDIKVCAVDNVWSALKLVIPLKDRK